MLCFAWIWLSIKPLKSVRRCSPAFSKIRDFTIRERIRQYIHILKG
ncbi:hypothetical protein APHCRT_0750 [Anaplasma phagocytophilum str. CRT53-1]|uniref:Uncharacterized protein n=1 Tax=Anaplasma phagocytophilum str. CRT53-1 TaxID=1359157 RepID=A0A0F3Q1Q6_ANAPH|nr:hypothetical protein APHCRT_0750 [Anaplasma phagocytophilum str. CRT53-1]